MSITLHRDSLSGCDPAGLVRGAQQRPRVALGGATAVARLVGDDLQQPRLKRRAGPEAAQGSVRLEQRVLNDVFGVGVAGKCGSNAQRDGAIALGELSERQAIAVLGTLDQV
jgi:hypothetical protein